MSTEVQASPAQVLAFEVGQIESELQKLQTQRQQLAQFPPLLEDEDPSEVAERISSSVIANSARLRGVESAISTLQNSLAAKRERLRLTQEQERKEKATQELADLHARAVEQCERINSVSRLMESEIARLRELEQEIIPARYRVSPWHPYPYLSEETLTVVEAGWSSVGIHLQARPLSPTA